MDLATRPRPRCRPVHGGADHARTGLGGCAVGVQAQNHLADEAHRRYPDLVDRRFYAAAPNRLWVADFTYVSTWMGFVYVAFVIDAYSRRILGWRAARSITTDLVLDAIEHAFFTRAQDGTTSLRGLIAHSDAGAQYTSVAFTQRLIDEAVDPSVGSVGDWTTHWPKPPSGRSRTNSSAGKALGQTSTRSSWRPRNGSTGFNTERPHEYLDDFTPEAVEKLHYDHRRTPPKAG